MSTVATQPVRRPAVAGMFYPGDAAALARDIRGYLQEPREPTFRAGFPKAVIVPHAGYIYSGSVAASAYSLLRSARGTVKRVVLLGPCHRVAARGLALPGAAAFETPLGRVPIDERAVAELADLPQVVSHPAAHAQEHSLEVQVPFLQEVLGDFRLVPLAVGFAAVEDVAAVIGRLWGGPETLIVVSSDLSHYHPYRQAVAIDRSTVDAILAYRTDIEHDQACGATPVIGLLIAAKARGLVPELLDLRNSGDTAGGRDRVVGYASIAFWEPSQAGYGDEHGRTLVGLARSGIASALGAGAEPAVPGDPWLAEHRATFVTLTKGGSLRGCIGTLEAHRPLGVDVVENARSAAFRDPRFPRVAADELASLQVEVSLLSHPSAIEFADHDDLVAQLVPGADGLILAAEGRRGTFLPQVWESLPDPEQFLAHLKQKAGLAPSIPTRRCQVWRYRVLKWKESEFRDP